MSKENGSNASNISFRIGRFDVIESQTEATEGLTGNGTADTAGTSHRSLELDTATMEFKYHDKSAKPLKRPQDFTENFRDCCLEQTQRYLRHWRDYEQPESYVVPPIFYYTNAEISDNNLQRKEGPEDAPLKHRRSDDAEHMVHQALTTLAHERFQAPFIAVHNLNIADIHRILPQVFPDLQWKHLKMTLKRLLAQLLSDSEKPVRPDLLEVFSDVLSRTIDNMRFESFKTEFRKNLEGTVPADILSAILQKITRPLESRLRDYCFREYDYVIIGPKVGLVVIEVKSSYFTQTKHFQPGCKFLPEDYYHGIRQLESVDMLMEFLQECVNERGLENLRPQKILFTPNLARQRFEIWLRSLDDASKMRVQQSLGSDVIRWFKEDVENEKSHFYKPPLYSALRRILGSAARAEMDRRVYEIFGPILVGLASVVVLKNGKSELNRLNISETEMILKESCRIESQNPRELLGSSGSSKAPKGNVKQESMQVELYTKIIMLTPDQQRLLYGPRWQLIMGAAGTGKTIVMQEKALRLLQGGGSVMVLASELYGRKYKQLFEALGFSRFEIRSWPIVAKKVWLSCEMKVPDRLGWMSQPELCGLLEDTIRSKELRFDDLWFCDHIFIDDALDWNPTFSNAKEITLVCLLIFTMAKKRYPQKTVWIAFDPVSYDYGSNRFFDRSAAMVMRNFFDFSVLDTVMRCPEAVFRVAYQSTDLRWPKIAKPHFGHKIVGTTARIVEKVETRESAEEWILWRVRSELRVLLKDGIRRQDVAIISSSPFGDDLRDFLADKLHGWINTEIEIEDEPDELLWARKRPKYKDESSLVVHNWHEISSFEWPVVIFASISAAAYQRYRAASRATGKLIEIAAILDDSAGGARRWKSEPVLANVWYKLGILSLELFTKIVTFKSVNRIRGQKIKRKIQKSTWTSWTNFMDTEQKFWVRNIETSPLGMHSSNRIGSTSPVAVING